MNDQPNQPNDHGVLENVDQDFYNDLVTKTKRYIGKGAANNEVQPESIVQSVLRSAMVKGKIQERSIEDMDQLRAFLIYKARRKIWDRRRKSRPIASSSLKADEDRGGIEESKISNEPSPDEIALAQDQNEAGVHSVAAMFAKIREDLTGEDWTIVQLRILDDKPWAAVAAVIGRTPGATRKHYSTSLRPKLAAMLGETILIEDPGLA